MNLRRLVPRALPVAVALSLLIAAPSVAREHFKVLLAQNPSGGQPDAAATQPAISGDGRLDRVAAYTSPADNIVAGSGTHLNVFLVDRKKPYEPEANESWRPGRTTLVSRGLNGQPANGDSGGASFDGYDYKHAGHEITIKPRCMAFVSAASNLVPGDTDGRADVFIRHLADGKLTRIAAPGPVSEVALDGRCFVVGYIAGGTVYTKQIRHGDGKVRRVSAPGGSTSPDLSANGEIVTYSRNGIVYVNKNGRTRKIAPGTAPSSDQWGGLVSFSRGTELWQASLSGAPHAHRLATKIHRQDHQTLMTGTAPSETAAGSFVFFVNGSVADSNVYERFGSCPAGSAAQEIAGSPHGNFAAFSCSSGELYMSYIGPH